MHTIQDTLRTQHRFPGRAKTLAIVIGIIISVFIIIGYLVNRDPLFAMTNQVYQETVSPDGKYVATLAYRDGLTFGYEYLSLRPRRGWHQLHRNDPIPDDEVAEMVDEGIESVVWLDAKTLLVKYDTGIPMEDFVKRSQSWRDVRLTWHAITPR